jgi:hypothetical protein
VENFRPFASKEGKAYPAIHPGLSFHVTAFIVLPTARCTLQKCSTVVPLYLKSFALSIEKALKTVKIWLEIGKKIRLLG